MEYSSLNTEIDTEAQTKPFVMDPQLDPSHLILPRAWMLVSALAGSVMLLAGTLVFILHPKSLISRTTLAWNFWAWGSIYLFTNCLGPIMAQHVAQSEEMKDLVKDTDPSCFKLYFPARGWMTKASIIMALFFAAFRICQVILWIAQDSKRDEYQVRPDSLPVHLQECLEWMHYLATGISGILVDVPFYEFICSLSQASVRSYIKRMSKKHENQRALLDPNQHFWDDMTEHYRRLHKSLERFWAPQIAGKYVLSPWGVFSLLGAISSLGILMNPGSIYTWTVATVTAFMHPVLLMYPVTTVHTLCESRLMTSDSVWATAQAWIGASIPTDERLSQIRFLQCVENHRVGVKLFGILITRETMMKIFMDFVVKLPAALNIIASLERGQMRA